MKHSLSPIVRLMRSPLLLVVIFLFGFYLNMHYSVHVDVQWLTHEAQLFFSGGHYTTHFVDPNPPLILFIYQPINWLHGLLPSISTNTLTSYYVYFIISLSLWRCHFLLKKNNSHLATFLGPLLACVLSILPMNNQGQRECLMITLSMPYLLSLLINARKPPKGHWLDTAFSSIGFMVKIQFLFIPLAMELLFRKNDLRKKYLALFLSFLLLYIAYIAFFTPNYWHHTLPLFRHYYLYQTGNIPFFYFLGEPMTAAPMLGFTLCCIICFFFKKRQALILLTGMCITGIIYTLPEQYRLYHTVPLLSYWLLLSAILIHQFMTSPNLKRKYLIGNLILINSLLVISTTIDDYRRSINDTHEYRDLMAHPIDPKLTRLLPLMISGSSPLITTAVGKTDCSRFSSLWMLPYFLSAEHYSKQDIQVKHSLIHYAIDDIKQCHPDAIITENDSRNSQSTIDFFNSDPTFKKLWNRYHLTSKTPSFNVYTLSHEGGKHEN